MSKRLNRFLVVAAVTIIVLAGVVEYTFERLQPYANLVQWIFVAVLLIAARDVILRLNASESKLRALVGSLDEVIFTLDKDGRYVDVVSTNRALLFRPPAELIGRYIHDVMPRDHADRFVAEIRRALTSDRPTSVDYTLDIDGNQVWFNASVTRLDALTVMWVARDITERKNAELELEKGVVGRTRELKASEERFRELIEQADEIIFTTSPEGIVTSLNPAFTRILGWSTQDRIGKPFSGFVPPEVHRDCEQLFVQLRREGALDGVTVLGMHMNGSRVPLELSVHRKLSLNGHEGFLGTARDVSQRVRAAEQLRRSERQLAEAQTVAKLGSWELDLIKNTLWWSEEAYRLLGMEPMSVPMTYDEFLGHIDADDRQRVLAFRNVLHLKGEHSAETELRTPSGERRLFALRGRVVNDERGVAARVIGVMQDITARRLAEEKLRESEERFRLATLATSEAMWDIDMTTGRSWHSEGYRQFGYDAEVVPDGRAWWRERIHPEDRDRIFAIRDEAWNCGQPSWSAEYRFRRADGAYAHVLHRALIVRDANKKPVRIVGALLDMTERQQLVDQLEQAKRVSSLGRVAASIAHEFNNILMGIQPNVEAIQRSSPTGLKTMTDNIVRAVQRGKRVTDEILRFTRPAEPSLQSVDVADFLAKWRDETAPLLGLVDLVIDLPDDAIHVSADPLQLTQIFTNLALNARDAMQDRPGRLTVAAHMSNSFGTFPFGVVRSPDRFVHFSVTDEGCGISSDRLNHIFEPLFTTKRGGIGLGLAVTYQIVTRHQGHIFVESEVAKGSTFHVFIPAALPACALVETNDESNFRTIRKLVLVEDEPAVASGIAMLLEMDGIDVTTVYTGGDAIPAIDAKQPDAVILDIGLPDVDGVGVYLEIERRWPKLAVLFSSGHGDSAKLEEYLSKPNVGFILKPYDFDDMRAQLAKLVDATPNAVAC